MRDDNAPIGYTCNTIDRIILDLETVRSDNSTLRDWGNELYEENEELKEQIDILNSEIEDLKSDMDVIIKENQNYESECHSLSIELDRLSSNLY